MHPVVYNKFEKICSEMNIEGSVLEIGSIPSNESLLCMESLRTAKKKIGLNIEGPYKFRDFKIIKGNSNSMDGLSDESFDVVLCNATLEHDKYFWKTIDEIKRVTKPGGLVVIGVPGYTYYKIERIKKYFMKIPFLNKFVLNKNLNFLFTGTLTFQIHSYPHDYYRFSMHTFKEVFFDGFENVIVESIMIPPRIIGRGTKK